MKRPDCLDAETLAAFAEGRLKRSEVARVVQHLDRCPECMQSVAAAGEFAPQEARPFRASWIAAAAVIAAVAVTVPLVLQRSAPMQRLVRLAPHDAREVEPRLSGGFAWTPYRGPMRANDAGANVERLKLAGEAASMIESANAKKSADAEHAAGVALLLIGRQEDAVERLRIATEKSATDAQAWSDLAAAEYSAALRLGRVSLYPDALAHVGRALQLDPAAREPLFNRALILERMGLAQQARDAWNEYVRVDGSSPWAAEAREHLARLPAKTTGALFKEEEPKLREAASRRDQKTVDAIVDRHRQQSRAAGEADYLGRWGMTQSAAELDTSRAIGDALARVSGELLLRDAVASIDRATPSARATLAEAFATYRRGRVAYSQHRVAEAESDLRRSAELFASVHDPMSLAARYYAANARFDQNDAQRAATELEQLRSELDAQPGYVALRGQVLWELLLCAIYERDWDRAALTATESMSAFHRIGETRNHAVIQGMRADARLFRGRPDDGWLDRVASFAALTAEGDEVRLPIAIGDAANVEIATGRLEAGRALLELAAEASHGRDDAWLTYILARDAMTASRLGEAAEAQGTARRAMEVAKRVPDAALRARAVADAQLAAGAIEADPRLAVAQLTHTVDAYDAAGAALLVVEAKLLRSRAAARAGDRNLASRDLDDAIAVAEKQPIHGMFVDDAGREAFEDAIDLALARGETARAFAYAERSRNARAVSVDALQQRLRASGAAILEVTRNAAFCVTPSSVDAIALRGVEGASPSALYDALVRPFESQLASARQLIVVASDTPLQNVAFAALYDARKQRNLVEWMPVSIAESASALDVSAASAPRSLVAVALRSGVTLAESLPEVDDIARLYPRVVKSGASARALQPADVIHISGHTERLAGSGDAALMFDDARVSGSAAATLQIGHPIVVLAACETLRTSPRGRTPSVGGGFLAAGATAVVGTLEPVADNEAREIFNAIHRGLAAGEPPAVAVQRAQIEAIARHSAAWRAVALLVGRITNVV